MLTVLIDQQPCQVPAGITVAAALERTRPGPTRASRSGQPRQAFCGMGQCQECRVSIDSRPHRLACMTLVADGMAIETGVSR
jgi:predicted molibdopterin-dependent oxidoreductase YjgC